MASNPITNCGGGRAVPYTLANSGGACSLPAIGIPPANVDEKFYDNGAKCGMCYEVTGPLGTQVVQVVDKCDANTGTGQCTGDMVQFGVDEATFSLIIDRNNSNTVYDLGYREVACVVTGNVKVKALSTSSKEYFFSLAIWNYRVGIEEIQIKASGWTSYEKMKRQGTSGTWVWNKNQQALKLPVTLYLVGVTKELISTTLKELTQDATVDFGDQFTNVASSDSTCPMSSSPAVIYDDDVAYGWDTSYTFQREHLDTKETTVVYSGTSAISVGLYQFGGLLFTRIGGYNPLYFSHLTFAAKANAPTNIKVYVGDGTTKFASLTITTEWTVYNISVDTLTTNSAEYNLAFLNLETNVAMLFFDAIRWEAAAVTPLDKVPPVEKPDGGYEFSDTTTGGVVLVDTTGTTGGFSFGSEGAGSTSSSTQVLASLSALTFSFFLALCL